MLGDQESRAGDKVVLLLGAAHRDPAVFAERGRHLGGRVGAHDRQPVK